MKDVFTYVTNLILNKIQNILIYHKIKSTYTITKFDKIFYVGTYGKSKYFLIGDPPLFRLVRYHKETGAHFVKRIYKYKEHIEDDIWRQI